MLSDLVKPKDFFSKKYAISTDYIIYDKEKEKLFRPIISTTNVFDKYNLSIWQIPILDIENYHFKKTNMVDIYKEFHSTSECIFLRSEKHNTQSLYIQIISLNTQDL